MKSLYSGSIRKIFLFTACIFALSGCGSSSSTPQSTKGSLTAKLIWKTGAQKSLPAAKTVYAAPAGVTIIKIFIYDAGMNSLITPKQFLAADGSGVIDDIPAGTGRTVRAWGLDSGGNLIYQGEIGNITIKAGETTNAGVIIMNLLPVTTADPPGGTYSSPQSVTLTANEAATIYYTTNGDTPTTSSSSGDSPVQNILIATHTLLKFFAVNNLNVQGTIKMEEYFITP